MYIHLCTGAAGVQELAEEVGAAGAVVAEEQEEVGAVVEEAAEGLAEGLAEGEEHPLVAQAPQHVIRGDRHASSVRAETEGQVCWGASRNRSYQHPSFLKSSSLR